jgi:hypothetical protein
MKRLGSSRPPEETMGKDSFDEDQASQSTASRSSKHRKVGGVSVLSKASPLSSAKSEAGASDEHLGIQLEHPRECFGCCRHSETGRCYICPDQPVVWSQETGRGAWCKECYTIWRTAFRPTVSQVVYEMQLDQDPKVRCEHWQYIAALVSLRSEGHARITKEMLETRRASLGLVARMMGIPFGPFVVGPRSASLEDPGSCMYSF